MIITLAPFPFLLHSLSKPTTRSLLKSSSMRKTAIMSADGRPPLPKAMRQNRVHQGLRTKETIIANRTPHSPADDHRSTGTTPCSLAVDGSTSQPMGFSVHKPYSSLGNLRGMLLIYADIQRLLQSFIGGSKQDHSSTSRPPHTRLGTLPHHVPSSLISISLFHALYTNSRKYVNSAIFRQDLPYTQVHWRNRE